MKPAFPLNLCVGVCLAVGLPVSWAAEKKDPVYLLSRYWLNNSSVPHSLEMSGFLENQQDLRKLARSQESQKCVADQVKLIDSTLKRREVNQRVVWVDLNFTEVWKGTKPRAPYVSARKNNNQVFADLNFNLLIDGGDCQLVSTAEVDRAIDAAVASSEATKFPANADRAALDRINNVQRNLKAGLATPTSENVASANYSSKCLGLDQSSSQTASQPTTEGPTTAQLATVAK